MPEATLTGNALETFGIVHTVGAKEKAQPSFGFRKLFARSVRRPRREHRMQIKLWFNTKPFQLKLMSAAYRWSHSTRQPLTNSSAVIPVGNQRSLEQSKMNFRTQPSPLIVVPARLRIGQQGDPETPPN